MKPTLTPLTLDVHKTLIITRILIMEHSREPTALLWSALAPCILFLMTTQSSHTPQPYINSAAWFYSYISASIAFFGFSFYLIGRRESGFIRSFIYERTAIRRFLVAHTLSYSAISLFYAFLFYLATKLFFGSYSLGELLHLLACFYTSYLLFTCIGLGIASLPIKFNTASTLFSLMSFLMLISGYAGTLQSQDVSHTLAHYNPLHFSSQLFLEKSIPTQSLLAALTTAFAALYLTARYFRIQPIWSRY